MVRGDDQAGGPAGDRVGSVWRRQGAWPQLETAGGTAALVHGDRRLGRAARHGAQGDSPMRCSSPGAASGSSSTASAQAPAGLPHTILGPVGVTSSTQEAVAGAGAAK